jgi:hypothetical protein
MAITAAISPSSTPGAIALQVQQSDGSWKGVAQGAISNGAATIYWTPQAAGTYTLRAAYQGGTPK